MHPEQAIQMSPPAEMGEAVEKLKSSDQDRRQFVWLMLGVTIFPFLFVPFVATMEAQYRSLGDMQTALFLLSSMHIALTPFFYFDTGIRAHIRQRRSRYFFATSACIVGTMATFLALGKAHVNYFYIFYHYCPINISER
jgi:hypothetical protein